MLIDLTHVVKNEDKIIQTEAELNMNEFVFEPGTFPIISKTPISLTIQNKGNKGLQINASAELTFQIPCDRCLENVEYCIPLDFERDVDVKIFERDQVKSIDDHDYIDGYNLDVDKLVNSEILPNWPAKILCREECKGICVSCGTNLNLSTCDCDTTVLDPRMAKILDAYSKFKEV